MIEQLTGIFGDLKLAISIGLLFVTGEWIYELGYGWSQRPLDGTIPGILEDGKPTNKPNP